MLTKEEMKQSGKRLRSPTPRRKEEESFIRNDYNYGEKLDGGARSYFSSRLRGTGCNMPDPEMT